MILVYLLGDISSRGTNLFLQGDGSAGNQSNNSQGSSYANNIISAGAGVGGGASGGGGGANGTSSGQGFGSDENSGHSGNVEGQNAIVVSSSNRQNLAVNTLCIYLVNSVSINAQSNLTLCGHIVEVSEESLGSYIAGIALILGRIKSDCSIQGVELHAFSKSISHAVNSNLKSSNILAVLILQRSNNIHLAANGRERVAVVFNRIELFLLIAEGITENFIGFRSLQQGNSIIAGSLESYTRNLDLGNGSISNLVQIALEFNLILISVGKIARASLNPTLGLNIFSALCESNSNYIVSRNKLVVVVLSTV